MVLGVVDSIDTDNIDAKVLEVRDVSLTGLGIGQGVRGARRTTRLVVDTAKIEALAISPESCRSINTYTLVDPSGSYAASSLTISRGRNDG